MMAILTIASLFAIAPGVEHKLELHRTFEGPRDEVRAVGFTPDQAHVYSIGFDGLYVWNIGSAKRVYHVAGSFRSGTVIPSTGWLVTGNDDGEVALWDWRVGRKINTFKRQNGVVYSVCVLGDKYIACGNGFRSRLEKAGAAHVISLVEFRTGDLICTFQGHSGAIVTLREVTESQFLSASADGTTRVWSVMGGLAATRGKARDGKLDPTQDALYLPITVDMKQARAISAEGHLSVPGLDIDRNWRFDMDKIRLNPAAIIQFCSLTQAGEFIVSGHDDGYIRMWQSESGLLVSTVKAGINFAPVTAVNTSLDGRLIVSGSRQRIPAFNASSLHVDRVDGMVRLWKIAGP